MPSPRRLHISVCRSWLPSPDQISIKLPGHRRLVGNDGQVRHRLDLAGHFVFDKPRPVVAWQLHQQQNQPSR